MLMTDGVPVRVAVVDSGVHAAHPHVGGVTGGAAFGANAAPQADYVDRIGHGTAVAAVIREKAPAAELFALKVFDRELSAPIASLVAAIDWASANRMHLVNLSLGTGKSEHAAALGAAVGSVSLANSPVRSAPLLPAAPLSPCLSSSSESTMAKLASSGRTSIRPRLMTMAWPIEKVSSGVVSSTRQFTSRLMSLVTIKLLTTVFSTWSTSPGGASSPLDSCDQSAVRRGLNSRPKSRQRPQGSPALGSSVGWSSCS